MLFRIFVATLDPLRELDLLCRGQQCVPAGLAQKKLQRVGRRLDGRGQDGGCCLALVLDQLVAAGLELAEDEVGLNRIEPMDVEQLAELGALDRPLRIRDFEELEEVLALEESLEIDCRLIGPLSGRHPRLTFRSSRPDARSSAPSLARGAHRR